MSGSLKNNNLLVANVVNERIIYRTDSCNFNAQFSVISKCPLETLTLQHHDKTSHHFFCPILGMIGALVFTINILLRVEIYLHNV